MEKQMRKQYTFIKKTRGSLTIKLEPFDYSTPEKAFTFATSVNTIVIPYKYALGLFISQSANNQLKLGYFGVEQLTELKEAANAEGLYNGLDIPSMRNSAQIKEMLVLGKIKDVEQLISDGRSTEITILVVEARENLDQLKSNMVSLIEEKLGVELRIE